MKLLALVVLVAVGCSCHVRNRVYNPVPRSIVQVAPSTQEIPPKLRPLKPTSLISPDCVPQLGKPCLAFIEFDEMGEHWDPAQTIEATKLVQRSPKELPPPLVLVFVHGWKNNAGDGWSVDPHPAPGDTYPFLYRPSRKNNNVLGFQGVLEYLSKDIDAYKKRPIIGVYIGWRGDFISKYWPVRRQFSYFNREKAAIRIPGADMTEALTQIMLRTREARSDSTIVLMGHSFGALVLERALTQAMTDYLLRVEAGADPKQSPNTARADLIIFVNSAASANEGKQMLDVLKRAQSINPAGLPQGRPLFLSISSLGDAATRFALPIGHGPSYLDLKRAGSLRSYDPPDPAGVKAQKDYYLHTAAHMAQLRSHLLVEQKPDDACTGAPIVGGTIVLLNGLSYRLCKNPAPHWNDTAYWTMQMPSSIVRDHSGIFNLNFIDLVFKYFQPPSLQ